MGEGVEQAHRDIHLAAAEIRHIKRRIRMYDMERRRGLCFGGFVRRELARLDRASDQRDLMHRRAIADVSETRYVLAHLYRAKRSMRVRQAVTLLKEGAARIQ
jgi:hypothetical protein